MYLRMLRSIIALIGLISCFEHLSVTGQAVNNHHMPVSIDVNLLQNLQKDPTINSNLFLQKPKYNNYDHLEDEIKIDYDYFLSDQNHESENEEDLKRNWLDYSNYEFNSNQKNSDKFEMHDNNNMNFNTEFLMNPNEKLVNNSNFGMDDIYAAMESYNLDTETLNEFFNLKNNTSINQKTKTNFQDYDEDNYRIFQNQFSKNVPDKYNDIHEKLSQHVEVQSSTSFTHAPKPTIRPEITTRKEATTKPSITKSNIPNKINMKSKLNFNSIFSLPNGKLSPKLVSELEELLPIIFEKLKLPEHLSKKILGSKEALHSVILEMVSDENVDSALAMLNELSLPGVDKIPEFVSKMEISHITDLIKKTDVEFISAVLDTLGVDTSYFKGIFSRVGAASPLFSKDNGDTESKFLYLPIVDASSVSNVQALGFTVLLFFLLAAYMAYVEFGIPPPIQLRPMGIGHEFQNIPYDRVISSAEQRVAFWPPAPTFKRRQSPFMVPSSNYAFGGPIMIHSDLMPPPQIHREVVHPTHRYDIDRHGNAHNSNRHQYNQLKHQTPNKQSGTPPSYFRHHYDYKLSTPEHGRIPPYPFIQKINNNYGQSNRNAFPNYLNPTLLPHQRGQHTVYESDKPSYTRRQTDITNSPSHDRDNYERKFEMSHLGSYPYYSDNLSSQVNFNKNKDINAKFDSTFFKKSTQPSTYRPNLNTFSERISTTTESTNFNNFFNSNNKVHKMEFHPIKPYEITNPRSTIITPIPKVTLAKNRPTSRFIDSFRKITDEQNDGTFG